MWWLAVAFLGEIENFVKNFNGFQEFKKTQHVRITQSDGVVRDNKSDDGRWKIRNIKIYQVSGL